MPASGHVIVRAHGTLAGESLDELRGAPGHDSTRRATAFAGRLRQAECHDHSSL